ncbi:MAG: DUF1328 domain-containing protein [Acidobacteriia bacterium]|nr:DUF1328 domain-containing protein [Terriglobia bacterium]
MLTWAIIFAVCALIFGLLGFSSLAAGFATIARFLLALFLILLVLTLIFGSSLFRAPRISTTDASRPWRCVQNAHRCG